MNPLTAGPQRGRLVALLLALATVACAASAGSAAASTEGRLDQTQQKISQAEQKKGVLTDQIAGLSGRIAGFESRVSALRAKEHAAEVRLAAKQAELDQAEAEVKAAWDELRVLAKRLQRSLEILRNRLVAIYQSGSSDISELVLSANDYGDLLQRSEYLRQIQNRDETVVGRVRSLRDQQQALVVRLKKAKETIEVARDQIAAEEQNIASARQAVESQQNKLISARRDRRAVVGRINGQVDHLEDVEADLQAKIQQEIAAASGLNTLPAGPLTSPSAAGLIWPVSGVLTSGFGPRSSPGGVGSTYHEGIDISVPEGTPIRAAASGTVILASAYGGYGNYTCVDHGSGLSTCYGHQSAFAVTSGQKVDQGQVIGYSGNTGASTGPHLHFEVRVNGVAQDPMGYL
ncbi:MAG: peptidoglycan DD-metalloendopeptidase family protein [Solirubrobacterales bacterium]|nr:peptidoglycan DD-metalloendopeptidase family protein [Solirubrobacterales bacterium]